MIYTHSYLLEPIYLYMYIRGYRRRYDYIKRIMILKRLSYHLVHLFRMSPILQFNIFTAARNDLTVTYLRVALVRLSVWCIYHWLGRVHIAGVSQ